VLVTDKLRSYGAARTQLGRAARHEQGLRRNNRGGELPPADRDDASGSCSASNHQDRHNVSCLLTPPPTTPSISNVISSPETPYGSCESKPWIRGERLRLRELPEPSAVSRPVSGCRDKAHQGAQATPRTQAEIDEQQAKRGRSSTSVMPADTVIKLHLIVAIDRTSKFDSVELHEKVTRRTAADFFSSESGSTAGRRSRPARPRRCRRTY
jgi:hypothetical protein